MRIWQLSLYGIAAAGISTAAAANIPAGTTETGGSVSRGDVQNVFGTVVDFAVHGTQNIMSGGESQNSEIYSYGRQVVEAGGISVKTQVFNNAIQTVGGRAEQTLINYGKQEVEAGGLALNSTLRNGILNVKAAERHKEPVCSGGRRRFTEPILMRLSAAGERRKLKAVERPKEQKSTAAAANMWRRAVSAAAPLLTAVISWLKAPPKIRLCMTVRKLWTAAVCRRAR